MVKAQLLRYKTGQTDCNIQPPIGDHLKPYIHEHLQYFPKTRSLPKSSKMCFHSKTSFSARILQDLQISLTGVATLQNFWIHVHKKKKKPILCLRSQVAINKCQPNCRSIEASNTFAVMPSMIPSFHNSARPERLEPQVLAEIKGAAQSFICLYSMKKGDSVLT